MKKLLAITLFLSLFTACNPQHIGVVHLGENLTKIIVSNPKGEYMMLPVDEDQEQMQVMLYTGSKEDSWVDIKLATDPKKVDRYLPFYIGTEAEVQVWIWHAANSVPLVQEISIARNQAAKN